MPSGWRSVLVARSGSSGSWSLVTDHWSLEVGFPIRISADQSSFAAPHGFSQRSTSFIACACQGIHRTPFIHSFALIINDRSAPPNGRHHGIAKPEPKTLGRALGPAPRTQTVHGLQTRRHKDDRSGKTSVTREPPVITKAPFGTRILRTILLFTMSAKQATARPKRPNRRKPCSLRQAFDHPRAQGQQDPRHWSQPVRAQPEASTDKPNRRLASPDLLARMVEPDKARPPADQSRGRTNQGRDPGWRNHGVVEPDGIEPTTSCLQSTRSPN